MEQQWESLKEEIIRLYLGEDLPLQQVIGTLKQQHSFTPSPQQLSSRLKKWKVRKNLKRDEWLTIERRISKRKREEDKESEVRISGMLVQPDKIKKETGRYFETAFESAKRARLALRTPTPEGCQIITPPHLSVLSPKTTGTIVIHNLPWLGFQRAVVEHIDIFKRLLVPFTATSLGPNDRRSLFEADSTSVYETQLKALVPFGTQESALAIRLMDVPSNVLQRLFSLVFCASNRINENPKFGEVLMEAMTSMAKNPMLSIKLQRLLCSDNANVQSIVRETFRAALSEGNTELVKFMIEVLAIDPNDRLLEDTYPLEIAARHRDFRMLRILLELGAYWTRSSLKSIIETDTAFIDDLQALLDRSHNVFSFIGALCYSSNPTFKEFGKLKLRERQRFVSSESAYFHDALWAAINCEDINIIRGMLAKVNWSRIVDTDDANLPDESYEPISLLASVGIPALRYVVRNSNVSILRAILDSFQSTDVISFDKNGYGLVYLAVQSKCFEKVKLLLERRASPNIAGPYGNSPLSLAIKYHEDDIGKWLLDWGACTERLSVPDETALSPLQVAAYYGNYNMASLLLERGVDINAYVEPDSSSNENMISPQPTKNALQLAVSGVHDKNRLNMVKFLVQNGADTDFDRDGSLSQAMRTANDYAIFQYFLSLNSSIAVKIAFHVAAERGDIHLLRDIIGKGADLHALDYDGHTPVFCAVHSPFLVNDIDLRLMTVSFLIEEGGLSSYSPEEPFWVPENIASEDQYLTDLLLKNGAYVDILKRLEDHIWTKNRHGIDQVLQGALLMHALPAYKRNPCLGHKSLLIAMVNKDHDTAMRLVEIGLPVSSPCAFKIVLQACSNGDKEILKVLLAKGAPVDIDLNYEAKCWNISLARLTNGFTPLQIAVQAGDMEMVQLILRENPSILGIRASFDEEETTSKAEPILCYAVEGGLEMVRHFLEAGVDVNEFVDNVGGRTALQRASEIGKLDIVELLLKEGADINAAPAGFGGVTALQAAAIESNLNVARRLLEEGADVNVQGTMFGLTVLEEAARQGRIDMVQLLLDNGADITSGDFGDVQYENAVNIAREEGHIPVVWMLEKHRKSLG